MKKLMTVSEAAERIHVTSKLVYNLVEGKRLTHYRISGRGRRGKILISETDLDDYLDKFKVEGDAEGVRGSLSVLTM